jgi:hypothetical protein
VSGSGNADDSPQAPSSADPREPDKDGDSSKLDEISETKKVDYRDYIFKLDGTKLKATPKAENGMQFVNI